MTKEQFGYLKDAIENVLSLRKDVLKRQVTDLENQAKAVEGKPDPFADEADTFRHIISLQTRETESYEDGVRFVLSLFEKYAIEGE